ncbi:MAG: hypothetical protein LBH45_07205 [Campylobacteraceae bacterium]|jgi:hypothetical protein|nr:hypothetical protein [Campylobacteraceae bacterium]
MKILNLTQHLATDEQKAEGVVDLPTDLRLELCKLLTFDTLEETKDVLKRSLDIARLAKKSNIAAHAAMIGGAPFFMSFLENALKQTGIQPLYAFTPREVIKTHNENGTVIKQVVFKHKGFIQA